MVDGRDLLWSPTPSVREQNRQQILRTVMVVGGSQSTVARFTGLSPATVSTAVRELADEGAIRVDSDGDRSKILLPGDVRGVAVGVAIGHSHLIVIARRLDSTSVHSESVSVGAEHGTQAWLRETVKLIRQMTARTGLSEDNLVSIGLALPVRVHPHTGRILHRASASGLDLDDDPAARLREQFGEVPVLVDNDANLGAFGESLYGAGADIDTMLYVRASTSVSAGVILNNLIFRGARGGAGSIGHLTMNPGGIVCRCGNRGCLETEIGSVRLLEEVRKAYAGYQTYIPTTIEALIESARSDDPVCRRVIRDAGSTLGVALGMVSTVIDMKNVIIGGALGQAGTMLTDAIRARMRENPLLGMSESEEGIRVETSHLGRLAEPRGALALGLLYGTPRRETTRGASM